MSNELHTLTIQLMDKSWQMRCPADKAADLQKSAMHLDNKMREISSSNKMLGTERTAIMAAINAIYDLLVQQNQKDLYIDSLSSHIRELQNKLAAPSSSEVKRDIITLRS